MVLIRLGRILIISGGFIVSFVLIADAIFQVASKAAGIQEVVSWQGILAFSAVKITLGALSACLSWAVLRGLFVSTLGLVGVACALVLCAAVSVGPWSALWLPTV